MNCPSHLDGIRPLSLSVDQEDILDQLRREQRQHASSSALPRVGARGDPEKKAPPGTGDTGDVPTRAGDTVAAELPSAASPPPPLPSPSPPSGDTAAAATLPPPTPPPSRLRRYGRRAVSSVKRFASFVGPGFVVAVAYIDPGNYSTDVAAGASFRFRLLFVVLLSNLIAIFLQSLAAKLGTVSGRNLAEACRAFLPRWLNLALYVLAELAIVATDVAEVIGTAIALNLLQPRIPLVAGCAISIVDVLVVLVFCRPSVGAASTPSSSSSSSGGSGGGVRNAFRLFEGLVIPLVLGVVVCFCIQLSMLSHDTRVADVFRGYLPSSAVVQAKGLYQACGILGATVMPHSLYLGSGMVQPRLRQFDAARQQARAAQRQQPANPVPSSAVSAVLTPVAQTATEAKNDDPPPYTPSLAAIRYALKYSIAELALSLFTFALFVNSAILIVAGAALYQNEAALAGGGADIFAIHALLSASIAPAAGTVFALALLLSGLSAGVVCTVAGQMLSEGALRWTLLTAPWQRRLLTRSISILPSIVIAGAVGRDGLDTTLNATQVVLSVVLPFVTAPLLWFTSFDKYMTVRAGDADDDDDNNGPDADPDADPEAPGAGTVVKMGNAWPVTVLGALVWLFITILNIANLVLLRSGGT